MRLSRNRNSEYLPQRRKGRKVRRLRVKIIYKSFCPFPISLAPLRLGGRNSRLRVLSMPDYLRRPRKFLTIVIRRARKSDIKKKPSQRLGVRREKSCHSPFRTLRTRRLCGEMFFGYGQKSIPLRIQKFLPPRLKNADCRLLKKISEARRAKNRRAAGVHQQYVDARRLSVTKHMSLFQ